MNKNHFLLPILILSLVCSNIYAQSQNEEETNWDKIENRLYWLAIEEGLTDLAEIHERIGIVLLDTNNQWERATVHFKKAVELDPKRSNSWFQLALIYGGTEEGNEYIIKAMKTNPYFPTPYFSSAIDYYEKGKYEKSEETLIKYLELAKGWPFEKERIGIAQRALADLRSGKEGKDLKIIRRVIDE